MPEIEQLLHEKGPLKKVFLRTSISRDGEEIIYGVVDFVEHGDYTEALQVSHYLNFSQSVY